MDFIISRTSLNYNERPCPKAKMASATFVDWRTCKSLEEVKTRPWGEDWFAHGSNHREENGMVVRDMDGRSVWIIQISNLNELLKFQQQYDDLIIQQSDYKEYPFVIEIYDGHRE